MPAQTKGVTTLLSAAAAGDAGAAGELAPLVYGELHKLAAAYMRRERVGHTLQPTALVHEAYLRLVAQPGQTFQNKTHFFGIAAHLMRQILVDHARARLAAKRGGGAEEVAFDEELIQGPQRPSFLLELDQALARLAALSPRQAQVVEMRYFAGLSEGEIAAVFGISSRTVKRDWRIARAFLHAELRPRGRAAPAGA